MTRKKAELPPRPRRMWTLVRSRAKIVAVCAGFTGRDGQSVSFELQIGRWHRAHEPPIGASGPSTNALTRLLRALAALAAIAVVLLLAGLLRFAVPPPAENRPVVTDAVVVLTGGSLRLQSGIDLMREGKGRMLFVSGVARRVGLAELLGGAGIDAPQWLACCVALGHDAANTFENAQETARWMRRSGYHSLRLVTAWYHMPRSLLEFERAMPDIKIVPHPVFPATVKDQHWWAWRGTAMLLIDEYAKYLAALLLPPFARSPVGRMIPVAAEAR